MSKAEKRGAVVKYQFEINDDVWERWKDTVPRSKSLDKRLIELIEADTNDLVCDEDHS